MIPPLTGWFSPFSGPSESPSHPIPTACQNSDARQEEEEELWELIEGGGGGGGSGSGAASAASAASRWRWNCSPACATSSSRRTSASTIGCLGEMLNIIISALFVLLKNSMKIVLGPGLMFLGPHKVLGVFFEA